MAEDELAWGGMARGIEGLGPGRRTVIWVSGCSLRCPGCMTPELLPHRTPDLSVATVAELILSDPTWGGRLTISGGEPFEQPHALAALVRRLRAVCDCEVLVYSGRTLEELRRAGHGETELLDEIDMLIDGPFLWAAPNELAWRGSDNQGFHALTSRGERHASAASMRQPKRRPLALQWVEGLGVRTIGIPKRTFFRGLREQLAARGLAVRDHRTSWRRGEGM